MDKARSICITALTSVMLASCSGGGGSSTPPGPGQTVPPIVTRSFSFPAGDAVATMGTAWDIVGVKTTLTGTGNNPVGNSYDMLRVDVSFVQNLASAFPLPGAPLKEGSQLGVSVALDTDANPATGASLTCDPNSRLLPFEFETDPGNFPSRLSDGNYTIISNGQPIYLGSSNPAAETVFSFNANTASFQYNLTTLGVFRGAQIPKIGVEVAAFNGSKELTDCAPTINSGLVEVFTTD